MSRPSLTMDAGRPSAEEFNAISIDRVCVKRSVDHKLFASSDADTLKEEGRDQPKDLLTQLACKLLPVITGRWRKKNWQGIAGRCADCAAGKV